MLKAKMLLLAILCICSPAFSEPLKVWGNEKLPPMGYVENNIYKGFGVEITKAVLSEAGIEHNISFAPWKRAYKQALAGKGIVFGMFWTEERSQFFDFSDPLWEEDIVLVTKKGMEFPFNKIEDLKDKKVTMQRGARPGSEFELALKQGLFIEVPDDNPANRLKMILKERVDVGIFNPGIASVILNAKLAQLSINEFTVLKNPLSTTKKHIVIAKSLASKDLIQRINSAIKKLKANGAIDRIMRKYESDNCRMLRTQLLCRTVHTLQKKV